MARTKQEEKVEVSKASNEDIARFRLGEVGYNGIPVFNGITQTEIRKELTHPESLNTYKLMSMHPSINAPLNLFDSMVSKANFRFVPPKDATEEEKNQTKIVEEMFGDMENSVEDFIHEAMTASVYGWAAIEKVYRKRTKSSGSMYDDGLIGIKKLSLRNQKSVQKFIFDDTGNEVIGLTQNISGMVDPYNRFNSRKESEVNIPRNKFMLITFGKDRNNPYGESPLRDVYQPWKYLQAVEELEAQSITKDINGLPVLTVPVQYLSSESSTEQKAQLEYFKNIMRNLQQGSQAGMILPSDVNPETRTPLFSIDLLTQDGKRNHNLNEIKSYYRTAIFIGMGADILMLGTSTGSSGSFALGAIKNSLTGNVAEGFIRRISQVVNDDLIKQIYTLNNWNPARRCKFDYEGFDQESLDEVGKFIQRVASVNMLSKDLDTINLTRNSLGLDSLPEDTDLSTILPDNTTRAAEAMGSPFDGTRTSTGDGTNASDLNSNNAA